MVQLLDLLCFSMEVSVYMSMDARLNNKAVFKRVVVSPDAFEYEGFVRSMKSVFGSSCVIEFLIV